MAATPFPETWRRVSFGLLVVASLASLAFWWRVPADLPTDADYRAANAFIAKDVRPGDAILLAPAWATRGADFLTAAPWRPLFDPATDLDPGTQRQWLVAIARAPRFDLEATRSALGPSSGGTRFGALWVERFDVAGPAVKFSFTDAVPTATVTLAGARPEPCPRDAAGRHQCSKGGWNHVRSGWYEADERPFHCIWAHPIGTDPVRIDFGDVPRGSAIRGRVAFLDRTFTYGATVELAIEVDGQPLARPSFAPNRGLLPFEFSLPQDTSETARAAFLVTSSDSGWRHFCIDAWMSP